MERYPKIPSYHSLDPSTLVNQIFYGFDKFDGSNIRAEWQRKGGFVKFGRRKALLDNSNQFLPEAEDLIMKGYSEDLERTFKKARWPKVTVFFEFYGPNSFAGTHVEEKHSVILLDVRPFKKGILPPREFLKLFGDLNIPKLMFKGEIDRKVIQDVEDGVLSGVMGEGVVFKGPYERTLGRPFMFKVKSRAWVERVRDKYAWDEKALKDLL